MNSQHKPVIGISCGDINGIGLEIIIKSFADSRILEHCTPVVFGSNKVLNFYKKAFPELHLNYQHIKEFERINPKQLNIFNCWEEDIQVTPGQLTDDGGKYAVLSLQAAVQALKDGHIDGLVTAPIHKKNTYNDNFKFTGHTPFLKASFNADDVVMMLYAEQFRVALVTEHVPVAEVAKHITQKSIVKKLLLLNESLKTDFLINTPRIAVLGLNPHAGDEGLIGTEEETIIKPAIKEAKNKGILAVGPYSADAFFARGHHHQFDAVLAMYHDQGLIPFKSLAAGDGVNYTVGLPVIRTSPDHGVAFDIAGKGVADAASFTNAIFECIDLIKRRNEYGEQRRNPIKRLNPEMFARMEDEKIEE
ncbi:4-hydroxythreonine-4-phosphate dehydrogenase PdxA [Terrimonas rubra]|uniref:4-hydroxythreonine-4-phosphate dehydrogenase PdxA n=1 Tax=Terrimonas rubra TaxID=1035890 RepID=A0ABW6A0Q2_9BACT